MSGLPYDAVLVLGFGGPEAPDQVMPFLENVTRGRDVPRARLETVAEQYLAFDGVSPINAQNQALVDAVAAELESRGRPLPVVLGNRNWDPYLADALREVSGRGHRRVLALATSACSSYSSCRQYLDDIVRARAEVGADAPVVDKVRPFWNHPGFVEAQVSRVRDALTDQTDPRGRPQRIVFTAHSIPEAMAASSDYRAQVEDAAGLVLAGLGEPWAASPTDVAYQSRSGPPKVPWLGPDIGTRLRELAEEDVGRVVVVPVGFLSDHMEVLYDLDTQAAAVARDLGIEMTRAGTVGTHPTFVSGLVDLLDEHLIGAPALALGPLGARAWPCPADCCPPSGQPEGRP